MKIQLTQNKSTIVDEKVYDYLNQFKWYYDNGYAKRKVSTNGKQKTIYLHRFLMGLYSNKEVDHINGDTLDNRKSNLRVVNKKQNAMNSKKRKNTSSIYKGVFKHDNKRWRAQITVHGKRIHLGLFNKEKLAARKYNIAAKQYFGQYAKLNKVL